jgi:hypothetical protein
MSPEQARGRPVDFRSDVYSLGVVLFEMLAGARPFAGDSPAEVIARQLSDPLPALGDLCPGLPPGLVGLVEEMTAKEPGARPASYRALLARIDALSRSTELETSSTLFTSTQPSARAYKPRPRARVVAAAAGAVAAVVALSGAWGAAGRGSRPATAASVAVAPFYGPDEASARDGRMLAALLEAELGQPLGGGLRLVGGEDAGPPIRNEPAARALKEQRGVDAVVWGQALSLGGAVEAQPWLTSDQGTQPLAAIAVERPGEPGSLARRRLAAQAVADDARRRLRAAP